MEGATDGYRPFATLQRVRDGTGSSIQALTRQEDSGGHSVDRDIDLSVTATADEGVPRVDLDAGRWRFIWASVIAIAVTAVPFVWLLWSDWGPPNPLRTTAYENNFYDLQTRAMLHGHLSLANGAIGLEGFIHDGRTYTYFGLFPSIIRMPILLFTSSLDGKLTAPFLLIAWLLTGLFASLLLWRVRFFVRGDAAMGRAEATAFGILLATLMGGTIWMLLATIPYVFNEDIAWSICLTVGSLFALLGVIERPSWGRIIASGVLILCANLDRATTGWACVVAAGLIAIWFLLGRGGEENRRWFWPVLASGLIPLVVGSAVNYYKFGVLFGVSNYEQVWTHVNAYRRRFLAANHNAEEGIIFVPTNLLTYLRPDGLSLSSTFPYVTLPTNPPTAVGGVLFDRLYRTASLPASSPLLFLLGLWGLVTAFRPKPIGQVARTRLLLLAAGGAGASLMLWGYIAPRYLGDFVPFLMLAGAVATADIFRRLESRPRWLRLGTVGAIGVMALFSITANIGMAVVPNEESSATQLLNYVTTQKTLSDLTGHPLRSDVVRGNSLPAWAPAGRLFVAGRCNALYVSNGENYSTVPMQQYDRTTWMTVQLGPAFQHAFRLTVNGTATRQAQSSELLSAGSLTLHVIAVPARTHRVALSFEITDGSKIVQRNRFYVATGTSHTVAVITDPLKHQFQVSVDGVLLLSRSLTNKVPVHVGHASQHSQVGPNVLVVRSAPTPQPTLCRGLLH
jgi:hypothetical protein